jgi:hypothetical protein
MYLHCKAGFFEVDRWDGTPMKGRFAIHAPDSIIVRARRAEDLADLIRDYVPGEVVAFHTPQWDYPFRCYLTEDQWSQAMSAIARDLDYRNFKHWSGETDSRNEKLAHDIWTVALADSTDEDWEHAPDWLASA